MYPTAYPEAIGILQAVTAALCATLAKQLTGLYLTGSLTSDAYLPGVSDVDLIAVTSDEISDALLPRLAAMHAELAAQFPTWSDRLEVIYVSAASLRLPPEATYPLVVISPGEPLHRVEGDRAWRMNWHLVVNYGMTVCGPSPATLFPAVSQAAYVDEVRSHAAAWGDWLHEMRGLQQQSYAVLTLCRALHTDHHGRYVSKEEAARWTQGELPQWAALIAQALQWRVTAPPDIDPEATFPETARFVHTVRAMIALPNGDADER